MPTLTRREALVACARGAIALPFLPRAILAGWHRDASRGTMDRPYLEAALRAEHWIRSTAIESAAGLTWPATPGDPKRGNPESTLYSGAPGVVLFYLELYAYTGEPRFLETAVRGARAIAASEPEAIDGSAGAGAGLYEGLAGHLFVLDSVHRLSGRDDLAAAAARAARAIQASATSRFDGNTPNFTGWNASHDIISGSAGIGLTLLALQPLFGDAGLDLARQAGDALIARSQRVADGQRRWLLETSYAHELPNFSHGTAGVAYYLATLAQRGGERRHLDAALDGARYLQAIAVPSGDGTVIYHDDGRGKNMFYLSWCHGPCGTARLWQRLASTDHSAPWRTLEDSGAHGVIGQGVPERRTEGFWNNISQCCGNSGVAEYFLTRWERTKSAGDLSYARRHADDALGRATTDRDAERWVQAENRVSPNDLAAQTGFMQGAAGVGTMLLHMDAATRGEPIKRPALFPDSPLTI